MKTTTEEGISISTPKCEEGIGKIIRTPDAAGLIDGVQVRAYELWPDDRGYFLEVVRMKQGLATILPEMTQVSAALSYPGTIKAFHYHLHQTDLWVPSQGMFQVALVDLRAGVPLPSGWKNALYTGALKPWRDLHSAGGRWHGYKVIGEQAGMLVYVTNRLVQSRRTKGRIRA